MEFIKQVDDYIQNKPNWSNALKLLRSIVATTELRETVKWGGPVYTLQGKNVLGLGAFKNHVCIWFFQGGLLPDPLAVLTNAQEGKTKAMRQWRFSSLKQIPVDEVRHYIKQAISNQQAGLVIKKGARLKKALVIPEALTDYLKSHADTAGTFESLSLSKKREFSEYLLEAKKAETKARRLQKVVALINRGQGLNDKYK